MNESIRQMEKWDGSVCLSVAPYRAHGSGLSVARQTICALRGLNGIIVKHRFSSNIAAALNGSNSVTGGGTK